MLTLCLVKPLFFKVIIKFLADSMTGQGATVLQGAEMLEANNVEGNGTNKCIELLQNSATVSINNKNKR